MLKTDNRQLNLILIKNSKSETALLPSQNLKANICYTPVDCWARAKSVEFVLSKIGGWRKLQGQLLSLQYCMLNPEDGSESKHDE